jgi:hypothetical protein
MHADIAAALEAQSTEIAKTQTLEQQNKTLLEGLNAKIEAGGNPAEVAAAVAANTAKLKTANDAIEADILANTPPA